MSTIPKTKHALRRICSIVLSKPKDETTLNDVEYIKSIFQSLLDTGLSPKQIQEKYSIEYTDFGMFLKNCLSMKIKSHSAAVSNFHINNGTRITNEKAIYKQSCDFSFSIHNLPFIPGIENLKDKGLYHPTKNPNGLVKDHMVSKEFGWMNKIDPAIISHPANCQLLTNYENLSKSSACCITLDQLMERISNTDLSPIKTKIYLSKSDDHRKKISESISKYRRITNGKENRRILKSESIPDGFRSGFTRKAKMVP